jgi:formylmethanofuran dehydrogenase subunit E
MRPRISTKKEIIMATKNVELVHCPKCGVPTVRDSEDLTYTDKLCEACYEAEEEEEFDALLRDSD